MAHIERIEDLERIVQALHGVTGHKWHRGDYTYKPFKACQCGLAEAVDKDAYDQLPTRWELDSEF